ncbi:MAG: T9SS type A sorting domain-containing protein [Bacteroidetes bacterium]|nr:T9SS type A sorting domain-containing protein [Bacteroidota bacterium]
MKKIILLSSLSCLVSFIYFQGLNNSSNKILNEASLAPVQGVYDDPYAAYEYRYNMIAGKNKYLDPLARVRAIEYSKRFLMKKDPNNVTTISSWNSIGPGNIGGRIRSILVRPSNSNTILIGSVAGGVWKSTNGGTSWTPEMDNYNPIAISTMANNGDTVYAGTGEAWGNVDAVYGGGIYKSTDFGSTWTLLPSTTSANISSFRNVLKIAIDPSNNIYAVTKDYNYKDGVGTYAINGGLYKSSDGGATWTNINPTAYSSNYFNGCDVIPMSSSNILFATKNNGSTLGGIYKTTDGGTTWNQITSGLPSSSYNRIAMAQDPNSANTVYAVFQSTDNSASGDAGLKGIYKSTDAGSTWAVLTKPPKITSTGGLSYLGTQGWYGNIIAVDPNNSNNIYVGGVDDMKSTNGGASWSQLTYWDSYYGHPVIHADHHAFAFIRGTANTVFDGDDGGIYKSTNGGSNWTSLNNGLDITQFYAGAVYPTGNIFYGGAQDNGHLLFTSGTTWSEVVGGDGGYAAIDQSNSNIAYEEYTNLQMSKTTDGGATWFTCTTGLTDAGDNNASLFISPFDLDPQNSSILIAGSNRVWVTFNKATSWTDSSVVLSASNNVCAVTIVNSASPYLGFAGTTDGKIFKCSSITGNPAGETWTDITPTGNNGAYVRRVVVDLNNKQHVYACYSGYNNDGITPSRHIYYSTDQGTTWSDVSGDLPDVPVHSLVIDPLNSQVLYIGTETGVYQSTNGGTNWVNTSTGMAAYVPVDELVRQTGTNQLFAFTHGRSAFETSTPLPVELSSINYSVNEGIVELYWKTITEVNNYGFEIERKSLDNIQPSVNKNQSDEGWTQVGFVKGNQTSLTPKQYSFVDENPVGGNKFSYRIKQIDNNGTYKYSNAIEVQLTITKFTLQQNYPNPFNPSTAIRYSLPQNSFVSLKVFDISGKEVSTLANEQETQGNHSIEFNANNLASGIYFYRIQAGNYTDTKKLILLK